MAFQLLIVAAILVAAQAGNIATPVAPAPVPGAVALETDFDPHPQYSFSYNIHDSVTGDSKGQTETRDGDIVHGSYNLIEADGTRRIVEYTADPVNGFNAVVRREPVVKTVVAKVATPVAVAHPAAVPNPVAVTHPVSVAHPVAHPAEVAHPVEVSHPVAVEKPVKLTAHPVAYTAHRPIAYTAHRPVAYPAHRPLAYAAHHPVAYPVSYITHPHRVIV